MLASELGAVEPNPNPNPNPTPTPNQVLAAELGAVEREYPQHEATRSGSDRFFEAMTPWSQPSP